MKGCSRVTIDDAINTNGLGFQSLEATCTAIGAPNIQSNFLSMGLCLGYYHQCRAAQLLEGEIPRLRELLSLADHVALP